MSHAMTDDDMVEFAQREPWAFAMRQGVYERRYEWSLVTLIISSFGFLAFMPNFKYADWVLITAIAFGSLIVISSIVMKFASSKLSKYDEVDSKRVSIATESMKEIMGVEHDDDGFKNFHSKQKEAAKKKEKEKVKS